jgi:hypothetical protein
MNSNKKDDKNENSLRDYVLYHLDKFFVEHIPSESVREMPQSSKFNFVFLPP